MDWCGANGVTEWSSTDELSGCLWTADNILLVFQPDFDVKKVIQHLAAEMVAQHWSKYTKYEPGSPQYQLLCQVLAHSLTGKLVTRTQELVKGGDAVQPILVQDVEADGMVTLHHPGEIVPVMAAAIQRSRISEHCNLLAFSISSVSIDIITSID